MTFKNLFKERKQKEKSASNEEIDGQEFKENLKYLTDVDDEIYGLYFTYEDPISGKISEEDRKEIIEESAKTGRDVAKKVLKENSTRDVRQLIKANNIELKTVNEQNKMDFVYFGSYETDGPITLYKGNIIKSERLIRELNIKFISVKSISQIVLAHELFHFYEDKFPDLYTNTKTINLWKLGPYTHKSSLICPGEIAAMAFTKTLLQLNFNPAAINYLLYSSIDTKAGASFYNKVKKLAETNG